MIIITGASKGLGRAICERLLSSGVEIFGVARDVTNVPFESMNCDVSSYDEVKRVAQALKRDGKKVSMRHASRSQGVVVEQELSEFLEANRMAGVMVVRPQPVTRRVAVSS